MIHLGDSIHHDGHGTVPQYAGCDCGCDPYDRDEDTEYWDKESHYKKQGKSGNH